MNTHKFNGFTYSYNENFKNQKELFSITSEEDINITDLYHYYSLSRNSIKSLTERYIYANHPYQFNDPYDCYTGLISYDNCTLEDVLGLNDNFFKPEFIKRLYESSDRQNKIELDKHLHFLFFNVIYLKVGIFCLTNNIESIEMWSYYSNHKGFTVKYDIEKMPQNFWGPFRINYSDHFEPINYAILKRSCFFYQSNIKSINWKPENEYRMIFYGPDKMKIPFRDTPNSHNRKFHYNLNCVKEIVLGYSFFDIHEYNIKKSSNLKAYVSLKTNKKLKRKVLYHILKHNIPVSMIRKKGDDFSLKPFPVKLIQETCSKYILEFSY